MKWPYQAEDLRIDTLNYIHQTDDIKNFLNGEGIFFVCGLEGMGKSIILKTKKMKYIKLPHDEFKSFVRIPDNYFDLDIPIVFLRTVDKWELFKDHLLWREIWGISIGLSIISNFFNYLDEERKENLLLNIQNISAVKTERNEKFKNFLSALFDLTIKTKSSPSQLITFILNNINYNMIYSKLFSELYNNILNIIMQDIRSGCAIFMDEVDQPWENLTIYDKNTSTNKLLKVWYSCQIGLIQAISTICTRNHHIKIYAAIRQEVLDELSETDSNFLRYKDKMFIINYKRKDLYSIFIRSIELFEPESNLVKPELINSDPIEAFFGFKDIKHSGFTDKTEGIFDYIYRYSFQRPIDILSIGSTISKISPHKRNKLDILKLINEKAEENLRNDYLKDFENLMDLNFVYAFSLIDKNILKLKDMTYICQEYNKVEKGVICSKNCKSCNKAHLFCSLYSIGLLGIVEHDFENRKIQKFLEPKNRKFMLKNPILPRSEAYLIHSAVAHLIGKLRKEQGKSFTLISEIIGDRYEYYSNSDSNTEKCSSGMSSKNII